MTDFLNYLTEPSAARDWFNWGVSALGWVEAATAVGAAYATRMIPLRTMAMLNNVLGVLVGLGAASPAVIAKHVVNFPLNARRMAQMRQLIAKVREANDTDLNIEWLKPFMHPRVYPAGARIFAKGDMADEAFVVVEGRIALPEPGVTLKPGDIFGEIALFTHRGERTASAICATDVRLLAITYEQFEQLYFQNPEFGIYVVRLIVRRFEMNYAITETQEQP